MTAPGCKKEKIYLTSAALTIPAEEVLFDPHRCAAENATGPWSNSYAPALSDCFSTWVRLPLGTRIFSMLSEPLQFST